MFIAIHINEKRLKDIDDQIDDPELENLVTEEEWTYIEKEKFQDKQLMELYDKPWYHAIHTRYQHLCQGPTLGNQDAEEVEDTEEPTKDEEDEKIDEEDDSEEEDDEEDKSEDETEESSSPQKEEKKARSPIK